MGLRYILQLESRQLVVGSEEDKDDSCLGGWGTIYDTGINKA